MGAPSPSAADAARAPTEVTNSRRVKVESVMNHYSLSRYSGRGLGRGRYCASSAAEMHPLPRPLPEYREREAVDQQLILKMKNVAEYRERGDHPGATGRARDGA